jgi:hypothetical protein
MKRMIIFLMIISTLSLSACNSQPKLSEDRLAEPSASRSITSVTTFSTEGRTFEEALLELTTDVVVVKYVGHRPFGRHLIEYEFEVLERVLGNVTDRIFVYAHHGAGGGTVIVYYSEDDEKKENLNGEHYSDKDLRPKGLIFSPDTEYLLPLYRISNVYATKINEDGFWFSHKTVIDLNNISGSTKDSGRLTERSTGFDFNGDVAREQIISYVRELTKNNPPAKDFIRSEEIEDIINGSANVLVVEIKEPHFLASESNHGGGTDTRAAVDDYFTTVLHVLKGDFNIGDEIEISFFAETVFIGEQHIVAIELSGGGWYNLTSRNSLFRMDQLDEIMAIISQENVGND